MPSQRFEVLPSAETCLIDFDSVSIVSSADRPGWYVRVRGLLPCVPMSVQLVPEVYAQRPDFWDNTGPTSFDVTLSRRGIVGTAGIEIVGATRRERRTVPSAGAAAGRPGAE